MIALAIIGASIGYAVGCWLAYLMGMRDIKKLRKERGWSE